MAVQTTRMRPYITVACIILHSSHSTYVLSINDDTCWAIVRHPENHCYGHVAGPLGLVALSVTRRQNLHQRKNSLQPVLMCLDPR